MLLTFLVLAYFYQTNDVQLHSSGFNSLIPVTDIYHAIIYILTCLLIYYVHLCWLHISAIGHSAAD